MSWFSKKPDNDKQALKAYTVTYEANGRQATSIYYVADDADGRRQNAGGA